MPPAELPPVVDLLKVGSTFSHNGKSYPVRKSTQYEQAVFSRWLEQRAKEAAARSNDLPAEVQDKLIRNLNADIAACEYEFGSPAYTAAVIRPFGLAKMLSIMLQKDGHEEVTHEVALEMVLDKYAEIAGEVLGRAKDDPKVPEALALIFGESRGSSTPAPSTRRSTKRGKKSRK